MRLLSQPGEASNRTQSLEGGDSDASAREQSRSELAALSVRLASRDETALAELYDRYSGRAFGLALRILGESETAEDVVHDAFLWVWEHADRIDSGRGSVGAFLLTVVHRRAVDQVRLRSRMAFRRAEEGEFPDRVDEAALEIIDQLDAAAAASRIREAVARLNVEQREAVELAYFKGMTHQQIATAREVPVGTVKSRLRLAMGRLRAALKDEVR